MRKFLITTSLLFSGLVTCLSLSSCSSDDDSGAPNGNSDNQVIANSKPGAGPIVVLGDSLAEGTGGSVQAKSPKNCLSEEFNKTAKDYAVPGLTSQEIFGMVPAALTENPKLIFLSSGGNDAISDLNQPGSYPESKTLDEMEDMFDQLLASGAVVIYLGLNPPMVGGERLPKVSQIAQQKGVIVVDGLKGLWGDQTLMADQLHPNDAGYEIVCDRILEALKPHYP